MAAFSPSTSPSAAGGLRQNGTSRDQVFQDFIDDLVQPLG